VLGVGPSARGIGTGRDLGGGTIGGRGRAGTPAWRLAVRSELTAPLDEVRVDAMKELYAGFVEGADFAHDPVVITAIKTVSVGLIYMIVASRSGAIPGEHLLIDGLDSEEGWAKLDRVIEHQMRAAIQLYGS